MAALKGLYIPARGNATGLRHIINLALKGRDITPGGIHAATLKRLP